jgi:hypothetical protein
VSFVVDNSVALAWCFEDEQTRPLTFWIASPRPAPLPPVLVASGSVERAYDGRTQKAR